MQKQANSSSKIAREIDKLNETESLAVLDYISELLSNRQFPITSQTSPPETQFGEDLIASLSDQRENKRARQVVEWEKVRRRNNYQLQRSA